MIISNKNTNTYGSLYLNNTKLERVSTFLQLGLHLDEKMSWVSHVTHLISKANKNIELKWKVSLSLRRTCAETIYKYYIRPQLGYGCVIYDSGNQHLKYLLEGVQHRAVIACTRAFNWTPSSPLLREVGWTTLEVRRKYYRLLQFYKMRSHPTPNYLEILLPLKTSHYSTYSVRHSDNYLTLWTRTKKFKNSSRTENELEDAKKCDSLNTFKMQLKKKLFPTRMQYASKGKSSINHTRMRLGISHLRQQLHSFGI